MLFRAILISAALFLSGCAGIQDDIAIPPVAADEAESAWLERLLIDVREDTGVPAIGAIVLLPDGRIAEAVTGVRRADSTAPVLATDSWHLGSLGKSMSAMVFARLADQGELSLGMRMDEVFPDAAEHWSDAAKAITIEQLLTQNSGLRDTRLDEERLLGWTELAGNMQDRRRAIAFELLVEGPEASPDDGFAYANINYVILAAVAETIIGQTWEQIASEHFIAPLRLESAAFGAPGAAAPLDAIWGHELEGDRMKPVNPSSIEADNPPEIAAAGTMHMTLRDWGRYGRDQMLGERGQGLLFTAEMYRRAHTPRPALPGYAYGWGVRDDGKGNAMLTHTGSNDLWYAAARLVPARNVGFLVTVNVAGEPAENALRAALGALQERLIAAPEPQED